MKKSAVSKKLLERTLALLVEIDEALCDGSIEENGVLEYCCPWWVSASTG